MKLSGAKIFIESLIKERVEYIFGYPGGTVIPIFDAMYDYDKFKFILTRHEQGAVHAADGYARVTGKVGVNIFTSGPGATNSVTGIATAMMDSIPLVVFTGQVPTHLIGNDAFQEADMIGITRSITKHNFLVKDVKDFARIIKEAFYIARTGRPGPVLVDIPSDVQRAETEFEYPRDVNIRSYKPVYKGNDLQIKKALELIEKSKKPVIYAGGGIIISNASDVLKEFAKKMEIPVTTTLMGTGAYPYEDSLFLGMLGMHGTCTANHAVQNSDLLVSIGSRFDDRVTGKISSFAPHAKIIHIDIDPTSISKTVKVDVPIVGDAKQVLENMISRCRPMKHEAWLETINKWKKEFPLTYKKDDKLRPQYVIEKISEITNGDAIICTEVGQHQMWAAQLYNYKNPRTFVSSGGLGTMGFGLPASIGAKLGCPDKTVFNIAGDGSIQMNIQELVTAVINNIPIKIVILNNGHLGMVRQWQEILYNKRYSHTILQGNPDFVALAEACGAIGIRVDSKNQVEDAIKRTINTNNVVLLDCIIEPYENVFPFVPAGAALDEIMRGLS